MQAILRVSIRSPNSEIVGNALAMNPYKADSPFSGSDVHEFRYEIVSNYDEDIKLNEGEIMEFILRNKDTLMSIKKQSDLLVFTVDVSIIIEKDMFSKSLEISSDLLKSAAECGLSFTVSA